MVSLNQLHARLGCAKVRIHRRITPTVHRGAILRDLIPPPRPAWLIARSEGGEDVLALVVVPSPVRAVFVVVVLVVGRVERAG